VSVGEERSEKRETSINVEDRDERGHVAVLRKASAARETYCINNSESHITRQP